jgi:hypothetical protein
MFKEHLLILTIPIKDAPSKFCRVLYFDLKFNRCAIFYQAAKLLDSIILAPVSKHRIRKIFKIFVLIIFILCISSAIPRKPLSQTDCSVEFRMVFQIVHTFDLAT